ncbi:MAG: two-component regulator propeller domain-containing protein [bacterium]
MSFKNFTTKDGLASNSVLSILEDSDHNLWFGTNEGVSRYDGQEFKNFTTKDGLVDSYVRSIHEDSNHNLWFGTDGEGVSRLTPSHLIAKDCLAKDPTLLYPVIYCLFEDAKYPDAALQDLIKVYRKENNQLFVNVLEVYSGFMVRGSGFGKKVLREAVYVFSTTNNLIWAKEVYSTYHLLYQAIQSDSVYKIILLNKDIEALLAILPDTHPLPSLKRGFTEVLYPQVLDTIQNMDTIIKLLMRSERVEEIGDKLGYLAEGLLEINRTKPELEKIRVYPEWLVFTRIFDLWLKLIEEEIAALRGRARLAYDLIPTTLKLNKPNILLLSIKNTGQSGAEDISIRLDTEEAKIRLKTEATQRLDYISSGKEAGLEFEVIPLIEGSIPLKFELIYTDAKGRHEEYWQRTILSVIEPEYEFRPIPENPYIPGTPVKFSQMFFGRRDVINWIESNIIGRYQTNVLLIFGERRCGKTSILYQLPLHINKYLFSVIDMQGLGEIDTNRLFYNMADSIYSTLKDAGKTISKPNIDDFENYSSVRFDAFIKGVEAVLKDDKPLVLVFDEFEVLRRLEEKDTGLLPYFRALMQRSKKLAFIFTGTHELKRMCKEYWSLYFNIGLERAISFLEDDGARELIEKPLSGYIEYEKDALNKILRITCGHPYFIQIICHDIVEQLKKGRKNIVSLKDVNEAINVALRHLPNAYAFDKFSLAARLAASGLTEVTDEAKSGAILDELIKILDEYKIGLEPAELLKGLNELEEMELIKKEFGLQQTRYRFNLELFRLWVKEFRPLARLKEEMRYDR